MSYSQQEILTFVQENDIKFIRLAFCDLFGQQKNISIMPGELQRAFTSGISFDASAIPGFSAGVKSDLLLIPDPDTISILPWRPSQGRVARLFCQIQTPAGQPYAADGRQLLRQAIAETEALDLNCKIGPECEFYLFQTDAEGQPTLHPQDQAGYMDVAPRDKGENLRREVCLALEELDIFPESSHHEQGPGQNEIDFRYSDPLSAADNLLTFRTAVKTIAAQNGLYASFLPKPLDGVSGSGLHINLSLLRQGANLFAPREDGSFQPEAAHFIAGVLAHIREITCFLNPLTNSYRRFGAFEAPRYLTWSAENRSQLIRIPAATPERCRMELRSPDPTLNPYLAFALILQAGLDGIRQALPLDAPVNENLYTASVHKLMQLQQLPIMLSEALDCAAESAWLARILPAEVRQAYDAAKRQEQQQIGASRDPQQAELAFYFPHY